MRIAPSGQDIRFDEKQIEEGRNFATKLWNAARFRQMHGPVRAAAGAKTRHELSIYAIEVLARLNETIDAVEEAYREYRFNEVAQRLYDFLLGRLLRLVRRSGEDRNFRRETRRENNRSWR